MVFKNIFYLLHAEKISTTNLIHSKTSLASTPPTQKRMWFLSPTVFFFRILGPSKYYRDDHFCLAVWFLILIGVNNTCPSKYHVGWTRWDCIEVILTVNKGILWKKIIKKRGLISSWNRTRDSSTCRINPNGYGSFPWRNCTEGIQMKKGSSIVKTDTSLTSNYPTVTLSTTKTSSSHLKNIKKNNMHHY